MKMRLLNMICSTSLWKIYLFNGLFPYFPIIRGSWTKYARHESSCSLTSDINMGLSVNGETKIPMDYNHVPHETEICGGNYTLISSTPVFPKQLSGRYHHWTVFAPPSGVFWNLPPRWPTAWWGSVSCEVYFYRNRILPSFKTGLQTSRNIDW